MSEKLKPCPFCGRVPKSDSNAYGGIVVWCNNKVCAAGIPIPVATWSRRASPSFEAVRARCMQAAIEVRNKYIVEDRDPSGVVTNVFETESSATADEIAAAIRALREEDCRG